MPVDVGNRSPLSDPKVQKQTKLSTTSPRGPRYKLTLARKLLTFEVEPQMGRRTTCDQLQDPLRSEDAYVLLSTGEGTDRVLECSHIEPTQESRGDLGHSTSNQFFPEY